MAVFTPAAPSNSPVPENELNALDILSVPLVLSVLTLEGSYPLCCPMESGLSSEDIPSLKKESSAITRKLLLDISGFVRVSKRFAIAGFLQMSLIISANFHSPSLVRALSSKILLVAGLLGSVLGSIQLMAEEAPGEVEHHGNPRLGKVAAVLPKKMADLNLSQRPTKPELVSPPYGQVVQWPVTLEWKPVQGADAYYVQIAKDPTFRELVFVAPLYKGGTTLEVNEIKDVSRFYWRVFAEKTGNKAGSMKSFGAWSFFETAVKTNN